MSGDAIADVAASPSASAEPQRTAVYDRPKPSEISVALLYPGNRAEKVTVPLQATDLDVSVQPDAPYERDIVLVDNPDRNLGYEVLKKPFHDANLVYRMRGDLFHELQLWDMHPLKKWVAEEQVVPRVDGVIAVCDWMARKMEDRAGVQPVGTAELVKDPDGWPSTTHVGSELRGLTLTNADYIKKIQPILDWAPVVEHFLSDNGGQWLIGGEGRNEDLLIDGLAEYDRVYFDGYLDAEAALSDANIMFHPSNLDALPNSILEGMASQLPVVTNDFRAFTEYDGPIVTVANSRQLRVQLERFSSPSERQRVGEAGAQYLKRHHTAEEIGRQYIRYFQELMRR